MKQKENHKNVVLLRTQSGVGSRGPNEQADYSRPSVAGTLVARLPQLFRTRSWVLGTNPIATDLG